MKVLYVTETTKRGKEQGNESTTNKYRETKHATSEGNKGS
jgi:hypothetical protein